MLWQHHGQGMAIVLMPGSGGTHDVYDRQVDVLLDAGCRVILLDREGRGQCDWGKYRFTNVGQARDAWAILDTIGINASVWPRTICSLKHAATQPSRQTAAEHLSPEVSNAKIFISTTLSAAANRRLAVPC